MVNESFTTDGAIGDPLGTGSLPNRFAMRCAIVAVSVAVLSTVTLVTFAPSAARAEIVITISKSQQRIAVAVDGAERYRWPVSTGRRGYDTPAGKFRPVRLERDWYSRKYDWAPMPHSIFFYRGYAMHGTLEEKNLGRRASHGCVRLSRENAATLFAMVRARGASNARIVVVNGPLPSMQDRYDTPIAAVKEPEAAAAILARAADDDLIQVTVTPDAFPQAKPDMPEAKPAVIAAAPARDHAPVVLPAVRPVSTRDIRPARAETFKSVGAEADVLRGREAWLRSLDRKYGIMR